MAPVVREVEVVRVRVVGFWRRALAAAIDACILLPLFTLVGLLVATGVTGRFPRWREVGVDTVIELILGHDPLVIGGTVLCLFVGMGYFAVFHAVRGRTLGKRLCRIRVITRSGERPRLARSLGRSAAVALGWLLGGLGIVWIGFDREKRGLHDWLAGTYVVREPTAPRPRSHLLP